MPVEYIPHPIRVVPLVIGARAYAGIYQNTLLRPLLVIVANQHTSGGVGSQARTVAYVDSTTPPGPATNYSGWLAAPGIAGSVMHGTHVFHVPSGWYYMVLSLVAGGGANALNGWSEFSL